jgi:hypothetical protein
MNGWEMMGTRPGFRSPSGVISFVTLREDRFALRPGATNRNGGHGTPYKTLRLGETIGFGCGRRPGSGLAIEGTEVTETKTAGQRNRVTTAK